jgi:hypothetical protein
MADDNVFRIQIETSPDQQEQLPTAKQSPEQSVVHNEADVPYTSYESSHDHPFPVEYFELGEYWNVDKGYTTEVREIEDFLRTRIKEKKITNSLSAMKEYLKDLELTCNVKGYDPVSTRLAKIREYIKTMSN